MEEYRLEIQTIRETLERLREAEASPDVIEEYAAELRNLEAIFRATEETLVAGKENPDLPMALATLGFGEWAFANVYAFVYEAAIAEDLEGHELSWIVNQTDYVESLLKITR